MYKYLKINFLVLFLLITLSINGQADRWQQRVEYKMNIDFDVNTHRFNWKAKSGVLQ